MKEKKKIKKLRGEMREIERRCQSMSIIGMYKLLSHFKFFLKYLLLESNTSNDIVIYNQITV